MRSIIKLRHIKLFSNFVFATITIISFQNCDSAFKSTSTINANLSSLVIEGTKLYANNCASCHNPISNSYKLNRTPTQIQDAIKNVPQMAHLKILSPSEINLISQALFKNQSVAVNPFICNGETGTSILRRLTKREYTATLLDLFAGQISTSDIRAELANIPTEFTNHLPSVRVFDSTNPNSNSYPLMNAYVDAAGKVADVIVATTAKMNAIGGTCISGASVNEACISAFIDNFGGRAYRRPVTPVEKTSLVTLYHTGTSAQDRMARVIHALVLSPHFLYLLENNGTSVNGRADLFQLDPYEIANRLSYGILGSMPDQGLFEAAKSGGLSTSAQVQVQALRLFGLPRAKEGIRAFYSQWLRLNYIPDIQVSAGVSNGINLSTLKSESSQEITELMDHLIWQKNANYMELMTTSLAIPRTANLAGIYGVTASSEPVTLPHPMRKGILTRVGLLVLDPTGKSNPIKRGVNARIHMLCDPMGPPPPDADLFVSEVDLLASIRDQVTAKTGASQCMACHGRINPAGFAFENFDGLGRYRVEETVTNNGVVRTHPINSSVSPNINSITDAPTNGAVEYQQAMAESPTGPACFAKQWLQYNTGRDAGTNDNCALAKVYDAGNKAGGSLLEMLKAYTATPDFMLKKLGPLN